MYTVDEQAKLIDKHLEALGEWFDVVQIMVSDCDGSGTSTIFRGTGNHWARIGLAHEFINNDKRKDSAREIAEKMHEKDGE